MRVKIEFLRDPDEELSVCFAYEAEALDLRQAIACARSFAKAGKARDARAFQIRDLSDEFDRVLAVIPIQHEEPGDPASTEVQ